MRVKLTWNCKHQVVERAQGSNRVLVEEWAYNSKAVSLLRESIRVIIKTSIHRAIVNLKKNTSSNKKGHVDYGNNR